MAESTPSVLIVFLTEECDQSCHHCRDSRLYSNSKRRFELAEIQKRIRELWPTPQESTQWSVLLTGGEPLLHPQVVEVIEAFRTYGVKRIALSTNGKELIKRMTLLDALVNAGVTEISLSTESDPETYQSLRGSQDHTALLKWTYFARQRYPELVVNWNVFIEGKHLENGMPWMSALAKSPVHRIKLLPHVDSLTPVSPVRSLRILNTSDLEALQSKIDSMPVPQKFSVLLPNSLATKWRLDR